MSIEIGILGLTREIIDNDELLSIKKDLNNDWLYFKDNVIFCLNDGFVVKDCKVMEEFAAYLWSKYKCLVGFDGAVTDGMFTTMMELYHYKGDTIIDGKSLLNILATEYYGRDTIELLKDTKWENLIPSIEQFVKENKPYYKKTLIQNN